MTPSAVAGLVLAAGGGRRFGAPKALVEVGGERLVDLAVGVLAAAGVAPVLVVSGAVALSVPGATEVHNPRWEDGIGSSLRAGLGELRDHPSARAVVVLLVDQPGIGSPCVLRLLAYADRPDTLAVATYGGRRSHPVLLGRDHWAGVADAATGDVGARAYLRNRADVVEVECGDLADDADLDTPGDLDRYLLRWPGGGRVPH